MKTQASIQDFLDQVVVWAGSQPDLQAVALVGSYARGAARDDSDIDLVLLCDEPGRYLEDTGWVEQFGAAAHQQVEDYGKVTSLRVRYEDGREVEFGLAQPDWAAAPLDEGTRRVIIDGIQVLMDRRACLSQLHIHK